MSEQTENNHCRPTTNVLNTEESFSENNIMLDENKVTNFQYYNIYII